MIVFDMAGTTVNEDNVVYKTLRQAINQEGFDFSLEQVLAEGAGKEKLQAIKSILSAYTNIDDEDLSNRVYSHFISRLATAYHEQNIFPQAHAGELFAVLREKNILVVLNTGYNSETANTLIRKLGWRQGIEYDCLITASDVRQSRPHPDMIWLAMQQFDLNDATEVVKVGDSIIDIEEGRNAGCGLSIGITTGAHTAEQLASAHPDYIIHDLLEILPLLKEEDALSITEQ
jgi:phosphonatase-like hydrolase